MSIVHMVYGGPLIENRGKIIRNTFEKLRKGFIEAIETPTPPPAPHPPKMLDVGAVRAGKFPGCIN